MHTIWRVGNLKKKTFATLWKTSIRKENSILPRNLAIFWIHLFVSPACQNSKLNMVQSENKSPWCTRSETKQNFVISGFTKATKRCNSNYKTFYCPLDLLCSEILAAVALVVLLSSLVCATSFRVPYFKNKTLGHESLCTVWWFFLRFSATEHSQTKEDVLVDCQRFSEIAPERYSRVFVSNFQKRTYEKFQLLTSFFLSSRQLS